MNSEIGIILIIIIVALVTWGGLLISLECRYRKMRDELDGMQNINLKAWDMYLKMKQIDEWYHRMFTEDDLK